MLDPLTLIERLAALVPRPRVRLTTYHGVFAPAAALRHQVVPSPPDPPEDHDHECGHRRPSREPCTDVPALPQPDTRRRYSWAELMKRVFRVDMLVCAHCGRKRKLPAALIDSDVIRKILQHLRLPTDAPRLRPPRPPPQPGLPFD